MDSHSFILYIYIKKLDIRGNAYDQFDYELTNF